MNQQFLAPRFWPTWIGVGFLYVLSLLPFKLQIRMGSLLGDAMRVMMRKRRHITEVNIKLCFPELSVQERDQLVRETFRENAIGIFEIASAWWKPDDKLKLSIDFKGTEYLEEALSQGKGVILLGAHFSNLDMGGRLLSRFYSLDAMYREHNNPLMDKIIKEGRESSLDKVIERENLRQVLRAFRNNHIVWYAPDQDFGPKYSVYAPFFGVEAATITATSRLVKMNNSPVVMFSHHRKKDNSGYEFEVWPPLDNFPSGDDVKDATAINMAIEGAIRKYPAQYMWVHRRFKTHPQGKNYLYKNN